MLIIPGVEADEARLAAICDKYGIAELKVFGSRARGQAAPDSDIDTLYALRPGRRLGWEIEQLADELAELLPHARPASPIRTADPYEGLITSCGQRPRPAVSQGRERSPDQAASPPRSRRRARPVPGHQSSR